MVSQRSSHKQNIIISTQARSIRSVPSLTSPLLRRHLILILHPSHINCEGDLIVVSYTSFDNRRSINAFREEGNSLQQGMRKETTKEKKTTEMETTKSKSTASCAPNFLIRSITIITKFMKTRETTRRFIFNHNTLYTWRQRNPIEPRLHEKH